MNSITHEAYQNMILSENDPLRTAAAMLPDQDRMRFPEARGSLFSPDRCLYRFTISGRDMI